MLAAATGALFLSYYHVIMGAEERRLGAPFVGQYRVWALAVPRFFVCLRILTQMAEISANTTTFRGSLPNASWFLFAIIGVELVERSRSMLLGSGWLLPLRCPGTNAGGQLPTWFRVRSRQRCNGLPQRSRYRLDGDPRSIGRLRPPHRFRGRPEADLCEERTSPLPPWRGDWPRSFVLPRPRETA